MTHPKCIQRHTKCVFPFACLSHKHKKKHHFLWVINSLLKMDHLKWIIFTIVKNHPSVITHHKFSQAYTPNFFKIIFLKLKCRPMCSYSLKPQTSQWPGKYPQWKKSCCFRFNWESNIAHWTAWLNESTASRPDRYTHSSMKPTTLCQVSNYAPAEKKSILNPEWSFTMKSLFLSMWKMRIVSASCGKLIFYISQDLYPGIFGIPSMKLLKKYQPQRSSSNK